MLTDGGTGRTNQKTRTRTAIVEACRELIQTGAVVTMPEVARLALVSEATAYRYFPDLATLVSEAIAGLWPTPEEALTPLALSDDPVQRIAVASEFFLRRVFAYQDSVRAMIAATITRQITTLTRPGLRFAWIDYALAPAASRLTPTESETLLRLKQDLTVVVSPESLFTLIDLCGLTPNEAVNSTVRLAMSITATAFASAPDKKAT